MTGFGFTILVCLSCMLFQCEGGVTFSAKGTEFVFLPGSTVNLTWTFDDVSTLFLRSWVFTRSGGSTSERLATISGDDNPIIQQSSLSGVKVIKPATLLLKNVNQSYDGVYKLELSGSGPTFSNDVKVIIAITPWGRVGCHRPLVVSVTDNFTCLCEASGGNPTAHVTWYKANKTIGEAGKEEQTLRLINVNRDDAGTYRCEAKSHESAINIMEIELIVNYPPENVMLKLTRCGSSVTIKCTAEAQPSASFQIFLNETELLSTEKTYTIPEVNVSHVGNYTCVAKNILGSQTTNSENLFIIEEHKALSNETSCATEWYIVVVSLVAGIIIGILFSYIVLCSRRKFESSNTESSNEPRTNEVDTTYQELDLTKMNKEDDYQSLRVNVASGDVRNDDDSNYTDLSKTRDVEDNYQSLT